MINPFKEISQRVRFLTYIVATLILAAITAYTASDGDWLLAAATFLGTIITLMSATFSNNTVEVTKKESAR